MEDAVVEVGSPASHNPQVFSTRVNHVVCGLAFINAYLSSCSVLRTGRGTVYPGVSVHADGYDVRNCIAAKRSRRCGKGLHLADINGVHPDRSCGLLLGATKEPDIP